MKANPYVSREELAEICGLTSDGIKYNIRKLREKGIIKRIGCGIVSRDSLPKVFKYSSIQLGQEGFP